MNKKLLLPILLILVLTLTACAPKNQGQEDENKAEEDPDENVDSKMTALDAFDKYMVIYPDTVVEEIELEEDNGRYIYEVEGHDGEKEYEVKIDSETGEIIKEEVELEDDIDQSKEITREDVEKIENLVNKALEEAGEDGKLDEWTLKSKNGKAILEIEIDKEDHDDIEYTYDLETGELL